MRIKRPIDRFPKEGTGDTRRRTAGIDEGKRRCSPWIEGCLERLEGKAARQKFYRRLEDVVVSRSRWTTDQYP